MSALKRLAYGAVELATGGRGVVRTIDGAAVRFPVAWARYYPSTYDPAKRAFLEATARPGTLAVDAGAHIGLYTVVLANAVGPQGAVVSFEPTAATREVLARTVHLNGVGGRVEVRPEAVTDAPGEVTFHDTGAAMSNANSVLRGGAGTRAYRVPATTIDAVVAGRGPVEVSCLKIDVEGAEVLALRGASETIERWHPAIALEVHPEVLGADGMAELWDLLAAAGYRAVDAGRTVDRDEFVARPTGFEVQCAV